MVLLLQDNISYLAHQYMNLAQNCNTSVHLFSFIFKPITNQLTHYSICIKYISVNHSYDVFNYGSYASKSQNLKSNIMSIIPNLYFHLSKMTMTKKSWLKYLWPKSHLFIVRM